MRKKSNFNSYDVKIENERHKWRYICNCGHVIHIYPFERITRKLCSFCGKYVYINKQEEFKAKIKEKMR